MKRTALSPRLRAYVDALPLRAGQRVVEIGCGTGGAAIEVARRVGPAGHVLAVDRSARAIDSVRHTAADLIAAGRMTVRTVAVEDLVLEPGVPPFDLAFAIRVGALDGRHRQLEARALERIRAALSHDGRLLLDGGDPWRQVRLPPA